MRASIAIVLLALAATGCATAARQSAEATPAVAPPTTVHQAESDLAKAHEREDQAQHDLAEARSDIVRLERDRSRLEREAIQRKLQRIGLLSLIATLGSVALFFVLPAGLRSWSAIGAAASLAVAATAFVLRSLVPHLEAVGFALVAAVIAAAAIKLWKLRHAAAAAADHGDRLEAAIIQAAGTPSVLKVIDEVKQASAAAQDRLGVRRVVKALRGKIV